MEYLNDEMDELFRKAGENYPLKTTDSDWDAVLGRLHADAEPAAPDAVNKKNRRRNLLWLLLLIPFGLFGLIYFSGTKKDRTATGQAAKRSAPARPASPAGKPGSEVPDDNPNPGDPSRSRSTAAFSDHTLTKNDPAGRQAAGAGTLLHTSSAPATGERPRTGNSSGTQAHAAGEAPDIQAAGQDPAVSGSAAGAQTAETAGAGTRTTADSGTVSPDSGSTAAAQHGQPATAQSVPAVKNQADPGNTEQAVRKKEIRRSQEKGIYLGLAGGPDLSTVKFQSVKRTGYSIGLLAGYRFNRHIAVETGLFWDKKQYYSDGKYFDKQRTGIPGSVDIHDIDGNCNMFELPVKLIYDFSFTRKGRFLAAAGLSSYFMKKENYVYTADGYGPGWSRMVSYRNSGNDLFSILQLSAGYEYNWGRIGQVRIGPYISIPLSGVGIGSLPISSAGLQVGVSLPLGK
jgi:hypothetical protein